MAYYDERDTQLAEVRESALFHALQDIVAHALATCAGWTEHLGGIVPASIATRADLARLPLLRKRDLIAAQETATPFAGLTSVAPDAFPRLFLSPGPICEPQLPVADSWGAARALVAAGVRRDDIVLNTFSYHLTPGGFMFDAGARSLGCAVIPAGPGNTEQQLQILRRYRPSVYAGTADFLAILLAAFDAAGEGRFPIRRALLSGAAVPTNLRQRFAGRGISVHELYGTAELGVVAFETQAHSGFVANEDLLIEIVGPATGRPLPDGEIGEVVVTRLSRDYPLLRFATGDLSAVVPGTSPCGRTNTRLRGWLGRADQTTKIKGMFVHPGQVLDVIGRVPGVGKGQLVVTRREDRDDMTIEVELAGEPDLAAVVEALARFLSDVTKLRGSVRVVAAGSIGLNGAIVDRRTP